MDAKNQEIALKWFDTMSWKPLQFQKEVWQSYFEGKSGLVNAPTGSGKTYSVLIPGILENQDNPTKGPIILWVTPIRALAKEIYISAMGHV